MFLYLFHINWSNKGSSTYVGISEDLVIAENDDQAWEFYLASINYAYPRENFTFDRYNIRPGYITVIAE